MHIGVGGFRDVERVPAQELVLVQLFFHRGRGLGVGGGYGRGGREREKTGFGVQLDEITRFVLIERNFENFLGLFGI